MFDVSLTHAAQSDLFDAKNYYEQEKSGLGLRFEAEIEILINRISQAPQQFPEIENNLYRAIVSGFPYSLLFHQIDNSILIIACFHASRDPAIWRKRV